MVGRRVENASDVAGSIRAWSIVAAATDVIGRVGADEKAFEIAGGMVKTDE